MEFILSIIIIAATCMTSLENGQLRQENQALKLENQKMMIEKEYQKQAKPKKFEESQKIVYSID